MASHRVAPSEAGVSVGATGPPVAPHVQDAAAVLNALPAVFVRQDVSLAEVLSGCEMQNKYCVYQANPSTLKPIEGRDPLFRLFETSSCLQRQCCGPMREFSLDMSMRHPTESEEGRGPLVTSAFRPFKCCEVLCFNRPEMFVKGTDGRQIGYITNPFTCCSRDVLVDGPVDKRPDLGPVDKSARATAGSAWPFRVTGACNQPGMWCHLPCGPCKTIHFEIQDTNGIVVGEIQKVYAGCCKEALEVSNFAIRFPAQATWFQKATLINCAVMMDFLWFEEKADNTST